VTGGPVNHGVYGPDLTSELIDENWLPGQFDFRYIFRGLLSGHLDVTDFSRVFPEAFIDPYAPAGIV
jgi:hypothetical protein